MSFYVTLPSHANKSEFPGNQANAFKIRLPHPLHLPGSGWQVGLSSISLPDSKVNIYHLVPKDDFIISTTWLKQVPQQEREDLIEEQGSASCLVNDLKDLDSVVDGVHFMKAAINLLEQQRLENGVEHAQGSQFVTSEGKHTYIKFLWDDAGEEEELLIDNTNMSNGGFSKTPKVFIHEGLAIRMGWLKKNDGGKLSLGPHVRQEFLDEKIPDLMNEDPWVDVMDDKGNGVFWDVKYDYLVLSMACRWRFVNLNNAFRTVVGNSTRPLHVYSDVGGSSIVGNQVTDLLREVQYK